MRSLRLLDSRSWFERDGDRTTLVVLRGRDADRFESTVQGEDGKEWFVVFEVGGVQTPVAGPFETRAEAEAYRLYVEG